MENGVVVPLLNLPALEKTPRGTLASKADYLRFLRGYVDFLSYIFNVSENTVIIHLIMVIWLSSFIMSSFKLASGPPQDPGGSKRDIFKIKEMIHRIFSVKITIRPVSK